eukprot:s392_g25.t1
MKLLAMVSWRAIGVLVTLCTAASARATKPSNQSVGEIVQEAALENLHQLEAELAKLQKGLRYAKTYLADSQKELVNLTAEVAKSNISEEMKAAKKDYERLHAHAEEVTAQETRLWKETLHQQDQMNEAKKKYRRAMQQLAVNEAALKTKAQRLAKASNSSAQEAALPHSGAERCGLLLALAAAGIGF